MEQAGALQAHQDDSGARGRTLPPGRAPSDDIAVTIGRRLRKRRRELRASQREIGARAGVSYQQIQRFEQGSTRISAAMVWRLAEALDVGVAYLFDL